MIIKKTRVNIQTTTFHIMIDNKSNKTDNAEKHITSIKW